MNGSTKSLPTLQIKKDEFENLLFRAEAEQQAGKSPEVRKKLIQLALLDWNFFFNVCLWTYDPRKEQSNIPFITYPYQDDFIEWLEARLHGGEDGLIEKSRDMGVSWIITGWLLWHWLKDDGFTALLGSYIQTLIDSKEDVSTHFSRLDYMIKHLPSWLQPNYELNYMKLINKDNGNALTGHAPTENFSRQGRFSIVWLDEHAFWLRGRSAWTATGDATRCRITSSTPNGKGNKFADLALKSNIKKLTLHWKLHPEKDQSWYEKECQRRTPEEIAQELDIDYSKSLTNRVYQEFCERNYLHFQEYDPTQPLYVAWDFGLTDDTAIIWLQREVKTGLVRIIDAYQKSGPTIDFYVPFITGEIKSIKQYPYSEDELRLIEKHRSWQGATHYGDPTGVNRNQVSGTSVISELRKHGIIINPDYINRKKFDFKSRIHHTKLLIRRLEVDKRLEEFIEAIENSVYPTKTEGSQSTTEIAKPVHDWTSHFRSALEYYAVCENLKPHQIKEGSTVITVGNRTFEERLKNYENQLSKKLKQGKGRYSTYKPAC